MAEGAGKKVVRIRAHWVLIGATWGLFFAFLAAVAAAYVVLIALAVAGPLSVLEHAERSRAFDRFAVTVISGAFLAPLVLGTWIGYWRGRSSELRLQRSDVDGMDREREHLWDMLTTALFADAFLIALIVVMFVVMANAGRHA